MSDIVERLEKATALAPMTASDREWTDLLAAAMDARETILALRKEVELTLSILDNIGGFLSDFSQADLDAGAADAVTVGMVYQQQAQTVVLPRIANRLAALRAALATEAE